MIAPQNMPIARLKYLDIPESTRMYLKILEVSESTRSAEKYLGMPPQYIPGRTSKYLMPSNATFKILLSGLSKMMAAPKCPMDLFTNHCSAPMQRTWLMVKTFDVFDTFYSADLYLSFLGEQNILGEH